MKKSDFKRILQAALLSILIIAVSAIAVSASGDLQVHFIDVGQGDSELIQFNGTNILIDGGTQDMGSVVESYLREHGVSSLSLVVSTHPHEDHIGGLLTVLNNFLVGQILDSGQAHTTSTFETYLNLIDQKNISYAVAERGQTIDLDPVKIEVLSPPTTHFADDLNQNSIVLKVTYNNVSCLFMGDAGTEAESSLLFSGYDLQSDILKVGHHGSSSASSPAFLSRVMPTSSIIEVGTGNDYGHPTQKTLNALSGIGSKVYRTDTNGNIVVTTDGQSYSVTTEKQSGSTASTSTQAKASDTWPASQAVSATSGTTTTATTSTSSQGPFVGSSKSDKYHYPSCSAAKRIKSSNLVTFSSSADARAHGYVPCGKCNPP